MCEAGLITQKVIRLSRRSYNHRIDVVSPNGYHNGQLARLNRELNNLYDIIYDEWTSITENDYKMFGGQLTLLIITIKQLYETCKKLPKGMGLKEETIKLGTNYAALYELNSDIVNFRIKLPKNKDMKDVLNKLKEFDGEYIAMARTR